MKKKQAILHMNIPVLRKKQAQRAAEKEDLNLTQWVNRLIGEKLKELEAE